MNFQLYPSVFVLIGIVLGVMGYAYLASPIILGIIVLISAIFVFIAHQWSLNKWARMLRNVALISSATILGIALLYVHNIKNDTLWYGHQLEDTDILKVKLISKAVEKEKTILYEGEIIALQKDALALRTKGKVNIYFFKNDALPDLSYSTILIPNKLSLVTHSGNPHAFNYAQYLAHQQQFHQAFLGTNDLIYYDSEPDIPLIESWRNAILNTLSSNISDTITLSLAQTILLNEKTKTDAQIQDAYSKTGIVHIVAISGMHISIMLGMLMVLMQFIKHRKYQWIKYLIALVLVWVYILLTHAPASAVRAAVMFTIVSFGIIFTQHQNHINTLIVTAIAMLVYDPNWCFDIGMQLSFLCMLSIFLFYEPLKNLYQPKNKILQWCRDGLAMSIAVQVLVAPLVMYYFYQFPVWTFIANFPAAIFSTIFLIGCILLMALGLIGIPMAWLGYVLSILTKVFNSIILFFAAISPDYMTLINIDIPSLVMLSFALICIFSGLLIWKRIGMVNVGLGIIVIAIMVNFFQYTTSKNETKQIFYSVANTFAVLKQENENISLISADTISTKDYKFNIMPSIIRYNVFSLPFQHTNFWKYHGKSYFAVDGEKSLDVSPLAIDNLVITGYYKNMSEEIALLKPQRIILTTKLKRWQAQHLENELANQYEVYNIHTKGALIE